MQRHLERRFIDLAVRRSAYEIAVGTFRSRYHLLFAALADESLSDDFAPFM